MHPSLVSRILSLPLLKRYTLNEGRETTLRARLNVPEPSFTLIKEHSIKDHTTSSLKTMHILRPWDFKAELC